MMSFSSLVVGLLFAAEVLAAGGSIKGKTTGIASKEKVYVYSLFGDFTARYDSVAHKAGEFLFKFAQPLPKGFYKIGPTPERAVSVVLHDENITLTGDFNEPASLKVEGSEENKLLNDYRDFFTRYNAEMAAVGQEYTRLESIAATNQPEYQQKMPLLKQKFDSLNAAHSAYLKDMAAKHPKAYVARLAGIYAVDESVTGVAEYFKPSDFTDASFLRGDFLKAKINNAFQRFAGPTRAEYLAVSNDIIQAAPQKSDGRFLSYVTIINLFIQIGLTDYESLIGSLRSEYPAHPYLDNFMNSLAGKVVIVGAPAPEISLPDTIGNQVKLSSLKGKVVLLDFWASWCGPCRMENPNVVRMYQKYKNKGFAIYSVSLDNSDFKWKNAILADNLTWTHVSDLKGWQSDAARAYGVSAIPSTFLLDKKGNIIAKNLRGSQLESKLEEIFNTTQ